MTIFTASVITLSVAASAFGASIGDKINGLRYGKDTMAVVLDAFGEPRNYLHESGRSTLEKEMAQAEDRVGCLYDGFVFWFDKGTLKDAEVFLGHVDGPTLPGYQIHGITLDTTLEQVYAILGKPQRTEKVHPGSVPLNVGAVLCTYGDGYQAYRVPSKGILVFLKDGKAFDIMRFAPQD